MPSHRAKKSNNVYINIQFWTSVASLFQQTPLKESFNRFFWQSEPCSRPFRVFSASCFTISFPMQWSCSHWSKRPHQFVESIWNSKKTGCLPWTQKDFYEFHCKIHRKVWSAYFLLILSSCQMCRVWDILNILLKNLEFNLPQSKIMKQQETHTSSNETFFWMIVIIGRKEGGTDS